MNTLITFPQGPISDKNGNVTLEWKMWFLNPQVISLLSQGLITGTVTNALLANTTIAAGTHFEEAINGEDGMSIVGQPGKDGINGITIPGNDGEDGMDGLSIPGVAGTAGVNGTNGTNGAAGAMGIGLPGNDGEDGQDGFPGSVLNFPGGTTTYLRGDNTWATVTATAPDIALSVTTASVNETITAGYSAVVVRQFKINSGKKLTLGLASHLRIL